MFADALLTGHNAVYKTRRWRAVVSSLRPENYSTSKPLKVSSEKSQILSYDTVVANEPCDVIKCSVRNTVPALMLQKLP